LVDAIEGRRLHRHLGAVASSPFRIRTS